jgi:hypothetical protein
MAKNQSNGITWNGQTLTVVAWSQLTGIPAASIYKRLEAGWSIEKALTKPNRGIAGLSSKHPTEYRIWKDMRRRCLNPNRGDHARYGERGITVASRWLNSFANFFADMGERPSPAHSIDRFPDNNGPYAPGNCRWATATQQARNKRTSHLLTFQGITSTIAEWAERTGLDQKTIATRINTLGWSAERALTEPPSDGRRVILSDADSQRLIANYRQGSSLTVLSKLFGISRQTALNCLHRHQEPTRSPAEQQRLDRSRNK